LSLQNKSGRGRSPRPDKKNAYFILQPVFLPSAFMPQDFAFVHFASQAHFASPHFFSAHLHPSLQASHLQSHFALQANLPSLLLHFSQLHLSAGHSLHEHFPSFKHSFAPQSQAFEAQQEADAIMAGLASSPIKAAMAAIMINFFMTFLLFLRLRAWRGR
jgi:hypothetical protein